jgi:hypothetical protein
VPHPGAPVGGYPPAPERPLGPGAGNGGPGLPGPRGQHEPPLR